MIISWIRRETLQAVFIAGRVKDGCFVIGIEGEDFNRSRINGRINTLCI